MKKMKEEDIVKNTFLSNTAKTLILISMGKNRIYELNKAGLSSSVIYKAVLELVQMGLLEVNPDKTYKLTEKGREKAKQLLECIK